MSLNFWLNMCKISIMFDEISYLFLVVVADYVGVEELVLTFGPSQSEHMIQISMMDDLALESTESFRVRLSTPPHGVERVSFIKSQATVTILDNAGEKYNISVRYNE